jgi:hypothetical protein
MAFNRWLGAAAPFSQVTIFAIDEAALTGDSSQFVTVLAGPASILVPLGTATTAAAVATTLRNAMAATSVPAQFKDATYTIRGTGSASEVVATTTAGLPVTFSTVDEVGTGSDPITSVGNEQNATGPNHYNNIANWSLGAIPVVTNDVIIDGALPGILYGLNPSLVTFASLTITSDFSDSKSAIGLDEINPKGYPEYRLRHLTVNTSKLNIGAGSGRCCQRINLNLGTVACETVIHNTASGSNSTPSVNILNNNASSKFTVLRGAVQIGDRSGGSVGLFSEGYVAEAATVNIGPNTVTTTLTNVGTLNTFGNIGTLKQLKGVGTVNDCGITTELIIEGGAANSSLIYKSDNTIPLMTLGGTFDASKDPRSVAITDLTLKKGSAILDTYGSILYSDIAIDPSAISLIIN